MIIVPKRKLETGMPDSETTNTIISHATETIITEIQYGYGGITTTGNFTWELQIPCGTNMYPGGHG